MHRAAERFHDVVGRHSGGLTSAYRIEDADLVLVGLGSQLGTAADVVDALREDGVRVGVLGITCFRPWPGDQVRASLARASQVVVLNRAISVGSGSILGADVRLTLAREDVRVYDVVVGLGGRPVTRALLRGLVDGVHAGSISEGVLFFPDLDVDTVARELETEEAGR